MVRITYDVHIQSIAKAHSHSFVKIHVNRHTRSFKALYDSYNPSTLSMRAKWIRLCKNCKTSFLRKVNKFVIMSQVEIKIFQYAYFFPRHFSAKFLHVREVLDICAGPDKYLISFLMSEDRKSTTKFLRIKIPESFNWTKVLQPAKLNTIAAALQTEEFPKNKHLHSAEKKSTSRRICQGNTF